MLYCLLFQSECSPAIVDFPAPFFTENLEEFEKYFFQDKRVREEKKNAYRRSKAGEVVCDFYGDSSEFNIFQYDEQAELLDYSCNSYQNRELIIENFYEYKSKIYAETVKIETAYTKFKGDYYFLGRYELTGVCRESWKYSGRYENLDVWGNPVFVQKKSEVEIYKDPETGLNRTDYPKEYFKDSTLKTYCWITIQCQKRFSKRENSELTNEEICALMCDILGEAG